MVFRKAIYSDIIGIGFADRLASLTVPIHEAFAPCIAVGTLSLQNYRLRAVVICRYQTGPQRIMALRCLLECCGSPPRRRLASHAGVLF